jgi:hypothetical protein
VIIIAGSLGVVLDDTVGERTALAARVVRIIVPLTLFVQQPAQVLLVQGGTVMGSFDYGDNVPGIPLAVPALGGLGAVVVLAVAWFVASATAVLTIGIRCTVFLVVPTELLPLRLVVFAVSVVDART